MIFIVDDDLAICQSLSFLLMCEGFESRSLGDACELLHDGALSDDDCLITDVDLPGMDGIELLKRVRDLGLKLPVIVMTGHPSTFVRERAWECGATAFLEKPLKDAEILSLIRKSRAAAP